MKQIIALFIVAAFVTAGFGASKKTGAKKKSPQVTVTGYLVDLHCAKKMMEKDEVAIQAKQHTRSCCMEPECEASGYGVFVVVPRSTTHASDVDYYKLNAAGNKMVKAMLASSTAKDNLLVTVSGKSIINVDTISWVSQ